MRVQRKRTKGFKMPDGVVYVGRGSKWGNPFKLLGDMVYFDAGHRRKILSKWVLFYDDGGHTAQDVVSIFRDLIIDPTGGVLIDPEIRTRFIWMKENIHQLAGKKLACWCRLDNCCHADVLIELANKK